MATIILTDDHILLRNGLASLVKSLGHAVLFEADNGKDFIKKFNPAITPDIVLMDINMPEMDGFETTLWLKQNHPKTKVVALSMYDNESAIIRMMKCGAKGYILKDSDPAELKEAIESILTKGYYYSELVNSKIMQAFNNFDDADSDIKNLVQISEKETEFLKMICTELTYKEIADKMKVSPRTVDNYRDSLFEKLHVKTRVGLAMFAAKNGIVQF
ncbi:MAG: response regulator transcription factor [Chitinophagaceae bacterium]|nr:response regulator transcription factor [Chitinophagaceae bacterium]